MIPLKSKKKNDRSGILERFRADNLSNYIKICRSVCIRWNENKSHKSIIVSGTLKDQS
jgi:hypothetical protein